MIFEIKKYEILASLYTKRYREFEQITEDILKELKTTSILSETDQKALNQINLIFKKFKKEISLNCRCSIHTTTACIKKHTVQMVRNQTKKVDYIDYNTWRNTLNIEEEPFRIMLSNVSSLQLSVGCSNFCRRCNEWALPGVRRHFTFEAVVKLVKEIFKTGNTNFSLYSASDPLDWQHKGRTIVDIIKIMQDQGCKCEFGLLTKIPKGSEKIIKKLLKIDGDFAVSITDKNRTRIKALEKKFKKKLNVQHDTSDLMIPSGLDEDFKTIKSSITDNYGIEITPEGAFTIIPTFTNALNLTGQHRSPVNAKTDFFLTIRVGIDALTVEYFKPLPAINLKKEEFTINRLLNPQIENIMLDNGSYQCTPPGMMSLKEYFETFEPEAVSARKKAIPAIVKRLKKEIFTSKTYNKKEYQARKTKFKKQTRLYLDFCKPYNVMEFKKFTFSFFLNSILNYIKKHQYAKEIILYLRKRDNDIYNSNYNELFKNSDFNLTFLVNTTQHKNFELFQMMMFKAIEDPDNKEINQFIKNNPARFNAATRRFTGKGSGLTPFSKNKR